jgi:lauroyl/myristoyl acyltransferase
MNLVKNFLIWLYWRPGAFIVRRLPAPVAYFLARACARILFHVASVKRNAYVCELRKIPGTENQTDEEQNRIVRHAFRNLICNEMEVLKYPALTPGNIDHYIMIEGREHLERALEAGRGAMLLFAHYGANQMVMPAIGHRGYAMCQMSAPPTVWPEKMPDRVFSPMELRALEWRWACEESLPVTHINIFGSLKRAFKCLKNNQVLGVAIDGGGGDKRAEVELLGRRAQLSIGALQIALRTGCTILPVFVEREINGRNRMMIQPPLQLPQNGDDQEIVRYGTQLFAKTLGTFVSHHPSYYLDFMALRAMMAQKNDPPLFLD